MQILPFVGRWRTKKCRKDRPPRSARRAPALEGRTADFPALPGRDRKPQTHWESRTFLTVEREIGGILLTLPRDGYKVKSTCRTLTSEERNYMESKKRFGEYICRRRKELGLTQREFADKLYVTESAVSKWERGVSLS